MSPAEPEYSQDASYQAEEEVEERAREQPVEAEAPVIRHDPLFEQVLRQTMLAAAGGQEVDQKDFAAILEVARRRRGQPFTREPVVVELVEALVESHFGSQVSPEQRHLMAEHIAEALLDDPQAGERLASFWGRISGAAK